MSTDDLTPKTRREVLMCREAFVKGVTETWERFNLKHSMSAGPWPGYDVLAERAYPITTVTRPRTITVPEHMNGTAHMASGTYRVLRGVIEQRHWRHGNSWSATEHAPTPERVAAWADLLANPTETVEDDTP